jgi:hypothetical protein
LCDAAGERRCGALDLGEGAERHRLEDRHARLGIDLRRDQQNVPQHHGDEEDRSALADIGEGHY